jgi:hypothetical protein
VVLEEYGEFIVPTFHLRAKEIQVSKKKKKRTPDKEDKARDNTARKRTQNCPAKDGIAASS